MTAMYIILAAGIVISLASLALDGLFDVGDGFPAVGTMLIVSSGITILTDRPYFSPVPAFSGIAAGLAVMAFSYYLKKNSGETYTPAPPAVGEIGKAVKSYKSGVRIMAEVEFPREDGYNYPCTAVVDMTDTPLGAFAPVRAVISEGGTLVRVVPAEKYQEYIENNSEELETTSTAATDGTGNNNGGDE